MGKKEAQQSKSLSASFQRQLTKLRRALLLFVALLALPILLLVYKVFDQLEQESFFFYRSQAEELVARIEERLFDTLESEEKRPFGEYSFYTVEDSPLYRQKDLRFSPLSKISAETAVPGVLGFFQLNPDGGFQSPLLPASQTDGKQVSADELRVRQEKADSLQSILAQAKPKRARRRRDASQKIKVAEEQLQLGRVEKPGSASRAIRGNAFSKLLSNYESDLDESAAVDPLADREAPAALESLDDRRMAKRERVSELNYDVSRWSEKKLKSGYVSLNQTYKKKNSKLAQRAPRKEQILVPSESPPSPQLNEASGSSMVSRFLSFEGDVEPFAVDVIDRNYLVFFRKVWRDKKLYVQGFLGSASAFFDDTVRREFVADSLGEMATLVLSHQGEVVKRYSPTPGRSYLSLYEENSRQSKEPGLLLYRAQLASPFEQFEVLLSVPEIPTGPGSFLVLVLSIVVYAVLLLGSWAIYKLVRKQIELAEERNDFVSAVSHELKTPLTSIRMYGEMLRSDWVGDEEKKKKYYDFIFFESERLSRLISNVLQLSKIGRGEEQIELQSFPAHQLLDIVRSKVDSQVEANDFELVFQEAQDSPDQKLFVEADEDAFVQIFVNLVDNAIKFSKEAENKKIELGYRVNSSTDPSVTFYVRDYGPGISKDQMKKIFQLFYRAESELTRKTSGTGIGLALVSELAKKMAAEIDVRNREPGAEFQLKFQKSSPS